MYKKVIIIVKFFIFLSMSLKLASILCPPRMVHNPFAVKVGTPTRSMADSTDHKGCVHHIRLYIYFPTLALIIRCCVISESRPILAPATLVLGRCTNDSGKLYFRNLRTVLSLFCYRSFFPQKLHLTVLALVLN